VWRNHWYAGSKLQILMGGVVYALDLQSMSDVPEEIQQLSDLPLIVEMPIGDCDVAASREGLSYDPRTVHNVTQRLHTVRAALVAQISHGIATAPSVWEAKQLWATHFQQGPLAMTLRQIFHSETLLHAGTVIKSGSVSVDVKALYGQTKPGMRVMCESMRSIRKPDQWVLVCSPRTRVVFDDVKTGGLARARQLHADLNLECTVVLFPHCADWDRLRAALGNPQVTWTSSLPAAVATAKLPKLRVWQHLDRGDGPRAWQELDAGKLPAQGPLLYVTVHNWDVHMAQHNLGKSGLRSLLQSMIQVQLLQPNTAIYAVSHSAVRKLDARWVNFATHMQPLVTNLLAEPKVQQLYLAHAQQAAVQRVLPHSMNKLAEVLTLLRPRITDSNSELLSLLQQVEAMKEASRCNLEPYNTVQRSFGIQPAACDQPCQLLRDAPRVIKKYGMLQMTSIYSPSAEQTLSTVADYVNAVDTAWTWMMLSRDDSVTAE